ncbi:MAG: DUF4384 domain-containing protein [Chitinivibrionales bacterium]|nr:DUF4384 domain-containing protein [Chitinivibrionales bacterium]
MKKHPDKLDLMSFFTGSCGDTEKAEISRHCAQCPSCAKYLKRLETENAAFLSEHPFDKRTFEHGGRVNKLRPLILRYAYALAASLILMLSGYIYYQHTLSGKAYQTKGTVDLKMYVKTPGGVIESRTDQTYAPGEQIQFTYSCGSENKFMLLSIDQTGTITTYYPPKGDSSVVLEKGQDLPLPNSIILDEYIGEELFLAVFSRNKMAVSQVVGMLWKAFGSAKSMRGMSLDFKKSARVKSVIITKQRPADEL